MAQWNFDPSHSSVEFSVRHLGVSWVKGRFLKLEGKAFFDFDTPEASSVEATIDVASITTGNEKRDSHLQSKDFFDVESHQFITFKSAKVEKTGDNQYKATGDLTMRGVTKSVVLNVTYLGAREVSLGGGSTTRAGFSAHATVDRHDFGISWDAPAGEGVSVAGGEVDITLNIEAIKQ